MKEKCLKNNNISLFVILSAFFFARTALLAPVHCFLMGSDYPYFRFSVAGVAYIVFAVVLSLLSAKITFLFREKIGEIAALVYIIAVSDPLFFGTKYDPLKLLTDIIIGLFIINALSDKKVLSTGIALPAILFISSFLVPFSVLGYAPIILSIFILASRKSGKNSKYMAVVTVGIVCAAAGFSFNRILMSEAQYFNKFFTSFTFSDITETTKRFIFIASFLPVLVFGWVFFTQYKKAAAAINKRKLEKKEHREMVLDAFFLPAVISFVSMFFLEAESFCAINIIVPAIILTLFWFKDEICIKTIDNIVCCIEENKIISLIVFVAVFALALKGAADYYPARQLIFYIIY